MAAKTAATKAAKTAWKLGRGKNDGNSLVVNLQSFDGVYPEQSIKTIIKFSTFYFLMRALFFGKSKTRKISL
jgi:hypothetical protein